MKSRFNTHRQNWRIIFSKRVWTDESGFATILCSLIRSVQKNYVEMFRYVYCECVKVPWIVIEGE